MYSSGAASEESLDVGLSAQGEVTTWEVSRTHGRLKPPGEDSAAKVIQDRDQIVPAQFLTSR